MKYTRFNDNAVRYAPADEQAELPVQQQQPAPPPEDPPKPRRTAEAGEASRQELGEKQGTRRTLRRETNVAFGF